MLAGCCWWVLVFWCETENWKTGYERHEINAYLHPQHMTHISCSKTLPTESYDPQTIMYIPPFALIISPESESAKIRGPEFQNQLFGSKTCFGPLHALNTLFCHKNEVNTIGYYHSVQSIGVTFYKWLGSVEIAWNTIHFVDLSSFSLFFSFQVLLLVLVVVGARRTLGLRPNSHLFLTVIGLSAGRMFWNWDDV